MHPFRHRFYLCLSGLLLTVPGIVHAQARSTASRSNAIEVFAGGTFLVPDFGTKFDKGFTLGGDFTHHLRYFNAGLEARYTKATGQEANESFFVGGLRVSKDFRRFHPYADFEIGHGNINFDHPEVFGFTNYNHDDSVVYAYGGGVDYELVRGFALKADAQTQRWNLGTSSAQLSPFNTTVGIVYRIPSLSLPGRH